MNGRPSTLRWEARLDGIAARLTALAVARDWAGLRAADLELAGLLHGIGSKPELSRAQRAAWAALRQVHVQVREQCAQESVQLNEYITQMRTHRQGWLAYAASNEDED
jgi:hypothetical protein